MPKVKVSLEARGDLKNIDIYSSFASSPGYILSYLLMFAKVKGKCHADSILFVIQHSA
jgi:hypothetical protein